MGYPYDSGNHHIMICQEEDAVRVGFYFRPTAVCLRRWMLAGLPPVRLGRSEELPYQFYVYHAVPRCFERIHLSIMYMCYFLGLDVDPSCLVRYASLDVAT